ncbi:hypothetical protein K9L27_03675 [Candidatus Gracilibacteria bacterium]|nr:hypothetical protein [Candidatus Gracilibacteria bacterium]
MDNHSLYFVQEHEDNGHYSYKFRLYPNPSLMQNRISIDQKYCSILLVPEISSQVGLQHLDFQIPRRG